MTWVVKGLDGGFVKVHQGLRRAQGLDSNVLTKCSFNL